MMKGTCLLLILCLALGMLTAVQRNMVVVEVATGTWCQYCPGAAMGCHDLLANSQPVAVIKNHNGDSYANTYSNARNTLYGISSYPTAKFDGIESVVGGSATSSMYSGYLSKVNTRMAVPAKYTVNAMGSVIGNNYTVQVTVSKPEADTNTNVRLHAVLTESAIPQVWFNQSTVENVNRLMIPDQNGTAISLNTGGQTTVELSFTKQAAWVTENCELVLFLQNMTSKEILQANKYSLLNIIGGYPLSILSHDFPLLLIGETSSKNVTIHNYASYPVSGTIGTDNPGFFVSTDNFNIPGFGSQTFQISFSPAEVQDYTGNLILTGNLWNYPNISVPLSGTSYKLSSDFEFSVMTGSYVPISGGTLLGDETFSYKWFTNPAEPLGSDTVVSGPGFPIGFAFNFLGRTYNRLGVHSYGWIGLGNDSFSPAVNLANTGPLGVTPISSVASVNPIHLISRISAIGNTIRPQTGSQLRVQTIGEAPNRECVIQWTNYRRPGRTDSFNFQIRLFENGNRIKLVYGSFSFSNATSITCDVGLRNTPDAVASNYYNLSSTTNWTAPVRGNTPTSRITLSSSVKPPEGLTYTWTPSASFPHAPILISPANGATGLSVQGFPINWSPATTGATPEYYSLYLSDDADALYDQYYWETQDTSFNPVTQGGVQFNYQQRWFWTVQAFNASGSILAEAIYRFDTEPVPEVQAPTTILSDGIALNWPSVTGAQSYNIYRSDTPYGEYILVGNTTNPVWTDPDFPASKAFYRITAVIPNRSGMLKGKGLQEAETNR